MFKFKKITLKEREPGFLDKCLFTHVSDKEEVIKEITWFPDEKGYRIRVIHDPDYFFLLFSEQEILNAFYNPDSKIKIL